MSGNNVTVREFELLVKHQTEINKKQGDELAKIGSLIKDTNENIQEAINLFREEVANTKNLVSNHIYNYNQDKIRLSDDMKSQDDRMKEIEEVVSDLNDLYKSSKPVRWAIIIVMTGALTAFGASLGGYVHVSPKQVKRTVTELVENKVNPN